MAHFARMNNDEVVAVHVVNNSDILDENNQESETVGIEYLFSVHGHRNFKQTSYNGNFRKNYAGIGYTYDAQRDAFIPPKPYSSWVLNENTCQWEAPVPYPQDGKRYAWNEDSQSWQEI